MIKKEITAYVSPDVNVTKLLVKNSTLTISVYPNVDIEDAEEEEWTVS